MAAVIAAASRGDAGAFLARLLRLDPAAVVRLRPAGEGATAVWARVPFGVLVTRGLRAAVRHDVTVRADALLAAVTTDGPLPAAVDHAWRWPLPSGPGAAVERLPASDVRRVAAAAAATAREALGSGVDGRAVGSRRLRDALLDHVPIVVNSDTVRIEIPQRLVQAVARMGFIGDDPITVRHQNAWIALSGAYGSAWYRPNGETLALQVSPYRPNG